MFLVGSPVPEGEAFAQRLQLRRALPHQWVSRGWVFGATEVTAEPRYKTHGIAKSRGLGDSVFFE